MKREFIWGKICIYIIHQMIETKFNLIMILASQAFTNIGKYNGLFPPVE